MKQMFLLSSLLILFIFKISAQELKETKFTSKIEEVTVFLKGAQIFETSAGQIPAGESFIVIKGLSPYVDEKSIQVKGKGNFVIQAVNKRIDYLSGQKVNEEIKSLEDQIKKIDQNQEETTIRLDVLAQQENLLSANKSIGGSQNGLNMTQLKQAMDFYESELTKIKSELKKLQTKLNEGNLEKNKLINQIRILQESGNKSTSEIRIRVKADVAGPASFELNYLVANAGWYPKYDVRVSDINSPLQLNYKAEVNQNTGVDWNNVKLRFSNGNPNESGQVPTLDKWELNFARLTTYSQKRTTFTSVSGRVFGEDGEPLPGTTVLVKGTTIGTATDVEGFYSLSLPQSASSLVFSFIGYSSREVPITSSSINVTLFPNSQMLNEVTVTGYSSSNKRALNNSIRIRGSSTLNETVDEIAMAPSIQTIVQENQTTVEIEVAEPYTIKSNGEKTMVDLKAYDIPANYLYSAIPKIDNDVFLVAEINDWNQYSLLEGESNLYFEDGFVGRSVLNASSLQDTLQISMGRDRSIVVQREKNEEFSKKRSIGSNITETREYKITVRNNKSQAVAIQVEDQIPVSVNSEITVEALELSGGKIDPQTGKVSWIIDVPAGSQKELKLQYEVKYPKREKVILD
ncbi:mucoidy inhibitor MuiA family protein [Algoriphagus pacificus]|uniref:Mucoidy inhibitor MuiA family protein n=1 Tax=Algoriphagus pacificus TaxID=2811234 RepID=A0ABS3CBJ7_9BACT|nr:mucoidy inhibitor MuiA family protein [Algoriphagus pacificus]MBN7814443.1 mucoidy inhibitor MuiA family protein [Algoriphagus pacificus]